jgi:YHS domain-containing protein
MFRALIEMIVTLVAVYLVRQVLAILGSSFKGGFSVGSPSSGSAGAPPPRPPAAAKLGELKKDPVCGTFISTETAFQKSVKGETFYFCSMQCRDSYNG